MYTHACIYVGTIYIYINVCAHMPAWIGVGIRCIFVCVYVDTYVSVCICGHVYPYLVYMWVCVCACVSVGGYICVCVFDCF